CPGARLLELLPELGVVLVIGEQEARDQEEGAHRGGEQVEGGDAEDVELATRPFHGDPLLDGALPCAAIMRARPKRRQAAGRSLFSRSAGRGRVCAPIVHDRLFPCPASSSFPTTCGPISRASAPQPSSSCA